MTFGALVKPWMVSAIILGGLVGLVTFAAQASTDSTDLIYWSDGDSGRLPSGTKFRLHGVDAPETGSLKQRGGAKCESERALGYNAKAEAVALTRDSEVRVTRDYGADRYGRLVVDLEVDGMDVAIALVAAGTHQAWDYDGGDKKPTWCGGAAATLQVSP